MRKFLTSALVAATAAGAIAATAAPAEAQSRYYHRDYYRHHSSGDTVAAAAVAGIAGLALGAALSSHDGRSSGYYSSGRYYNGYSYDPRYDSYGGGYYARPYYAPPRMCITQDRVWDPYIGRYVITEHRYAC